MHVEETKTTLQFASRAKKVTNCAQVNEVMTDAALLKRQAREIEDLRQKLQEVNSEEMNEQIQLLRNKLLKDFRRPMIPLPVNEGVPDSAWKEGGPPPSSVTVGRRMRPPLPPMLIEKLDEEGTSAATGVPVENSENDMEKSERTIPSGGQASSGGDVGEEEVTSRRLSTGQMAHGRTSFGNGRVSSGGRISMDSLLTGHVTDRKGRLSCDPAEAMQQQFLELQHKYETLKFQHEALIIQTEREANCDDNGQSEGGQEDMDGLSPVDEDDCLNDDQGEAIVKEGCQSEECATAVERQFLENQKTTEISHSPDAEGFSHSEIEADVTASKLECKRLREEVVELNLLLKQRENSIEDLHSQLVEKTNTLKEIETHGSHREEEMAHIRERLLAMEADSVQLEESRTQLLKELEEARQLLHANSNREDFLRQRHFGSSDDGRMGESPENTGLAEEQNVLKQDGALLIGCSEDVEGLWQQMEELQRVKQELEQRLMDQADQIFTLEEERVGSLAEMKGLEDELSEVKLTLNSMNMRILEVEDDCQQKVKELRAAEESRLRLCEELEQVRQVVSSRSEREGIMGFEASDTVSASPHLEDYCRKLKTDLDLSNRRVSDLEKEVLAKMEESRMLSELFKQTMEQQHQERPVGERGIVCAPEETSFKEIKLRLGSESELAGDLMGPSSEREEMWEYAGPEDKARDGSENAAGEDCPRQLKTEHELPDAPVGDQQRMESTRLTEAEESISMMSPRFKQVTEREGVSTERAARALGEASVSKLPAICEQPVEFLQRLKSFLELSVAHWNDLERDIAAQIRVCELLKEELRPRSEEEAGNLLLAQEEPREVLIENARVKNEVAMLNQCLELCLNRIQAIKVECDVNIGNLTLHLSTSNSLLKHSTGLDEEREWTDADSWMWDNLDRGPQGSAEKGTVGEKGHDDELARLMMDRDNLLANNASLQEAIVGLNLGIEVAMKRVQELEEQCRYQSRGLEAVEESQVLRNSELQEARKLLAAAVEREQDLERRVAASERAVLEAVSEKTGLEEEIRGLEQKLELSNQQVADGHLSAVSSENSEMEDDLLNSRLDVEASKKQIEELEERCGYQSKNLETLEECRAVLSQELDEARKLLTASVDREKELESRVADFDKGRAAMEREKDLEMRVAGAERAMFGAVSEKSGLEEEIRVLKEKLELSNRQGEDQPLSTVSSQNTEMEEDLPNLSLDVEASKKQIEELEERCGYQSKNLETLEESRAVLSQELDEARKLLTASVDREKDLESRVAASEQAILEAASVKQGLEEMVRMLEERLEERFEVPNQEVADPDPSDVVPRDPGVEDECAQLRLDIEESKRRARKLEEQCGRQSEETEVLRKELVEAREALAATIARENELQSRIVAAEKMMSEAVSEKIGLEEEVKILGEKLEVLSQKVAGMDQSSAEQAEDLAAARKELCKVVAEKVSLEEEVTAWKRSLELATRASHLLKEQCEVQLAKLGISTDFRSRESLNASSNFVDDAELMAANSERFLPIEVSEKTGLEGEIRIFKETIDALYRQVACLQTGSQVVLQESETLQKELQQQLLALEEKNRTAIEVKEKLEDELEAVNGRLESAESRAQVLVEGLQTQNEKLRLSESSSSQLTKEVEELRQLVSEGVEREAGFEVRLEAAERGRLDAVAEKMQQEEELVRLKQTIELCRARSCALEKECQTHRETIAALEDSRLKLCQVVEELRESLSASSQMEERLQEMHATSEAARLEAVSRNSELKDELQTLNRELDGSNGRAEDLRKKYEMQAQEIQMWKEELEQHIKEHARELAISNEERQSALASKEELEKELAELLERFILSNQRVKDLADDCEKHEAGLQTAEDLRLKLTNELQEVQESLHASLQREKDLEGKVAAAENAKSAALSENAGLARALSDLQGEAQTYEREATTLSEKGEELERNLEEQGAQLSALEEEKCRLLQENSSLKDNLVELKESLESSEGRVQGLEEESKALSEKLVKMEKEMQRRVEEQAALVRNQEARCNSALHQLATVDLEKTDLIKKLSDMESLLSHEKTAASEAVQELEAWKQRHAQELGTLRTELVNTRKDLTAAKVQPAALAKEKEALRKELEKAKEKMEKLDAKLKNTLQEKNNLVTERIHMERDLKLLRGQSFAQAKDLSKLESAYDKRRESVAEKRRESIAVQKRSRSQYEELEAMLQSKCTELEEQKSDLQSAQGRLQQLDSENEWLKKQLEESKAEIDRMKEEAAHRTEELSRKSKQMEELDDQIKSMSLLGKCMELHECQQRVEKLEMELKAEEEKAYAALTDADFAFAVESSSMKAQLAEKEREYQRIVEAHDAVCKELEQALAEGQRSRQDLEERILEMERRKEEDMREARLKFEVEERSKARLKFEVEERSSVKAQLAEKERESQQMVEAHNAVRKELEQALAEEQSICRGLEERLLEMERRRDDDLREARLKFEVEKSNIEARMEEEGRKHEQLVEAHEAQRKELGEALMEAERSQQELAERLSDLERMENEVQRAMMEVLSKEEELKCLQESCRNQQLQASVRLKKVEADFEQERAQYEAKLFRKEYMLDLQCQLMEYCKEGIPELKETFNSSIEEVRCQLQSEYLKVLETNQELLQQQEDAEKELHAAFAELEASCQARNDQQDQINELQSEIASLREKLTCFQEMHLWEEELENKTRIAEDLRIQLRNSKALILSLEQELEDVRSKNGERISLQKELGTSSNNSGRVWSSELMLIKDDCEASRDEIDRLLSEKRKDMVDMELKNIALQERVIRMEKNLDIAKERNAKLQNEKQILEQKCMEGQMAIEELAKVTERLKVAQYGRTQLGGQIRDYRRRLETVEVNHKLLQNQVLELKAELQRANTENMQFQAQFHELAMRPARMRRQELERQGAGGSDRTLGCFGPRSRNPNQGQGS
ncbi:hypothetical protein CBR_g45521 [Chara braunii]|uniref:Kinesin motor domain-containing protein n=1 Tax=Chara braunii TaxID=69332 RepID=A0A388LYY2_CHABU|nr:hypothetical protein CBR_g45521 [Chara braunii]|eukprot:GBG87463.1 hypothetical protein CBR_g45521 [Chara braunii]